MALCSCDRTTGLSNVSRDNNVVKNYDVIKMPTNAKVSAAKIIPSEGRISYVTSVTEATTAFDAIVLGRPTQDFVAREHAVRYMPKDPGDDDPNQYVSAEWSEGAFVIDRVLFQKPSNSLTMGQNLPIVEPVGVAVTSPTEAVRSVFEECFELEQNSQYVLFLTRGTDGTYVIDNFNLGRFNTDGTDCEDEVSNTNGLKLDGTKTDKQKLREELTARYGITFAPIGPCVSSGPVQITSAMIGGGGKPLPIIPGLPTPAPPRDFVTCRINAPQPSGGRLLIEQQVVGSTTWNSIADVAVTVSAQTGTTPVSQSVEIPRGVLSAGAKVRARLRNGTTFSEWSNLATVILPL